MTLPVGQLNPAPRLLLGPGPSDAHPRVLSVMSTPLLGHLDPQFLDIMNETQELMRWAYRTQNRLTFPVSATGSAGMECCLVNLLEPNANRLSQILLGHALKPPALTQALSDMQVDRIFHCYAPSHFPDQLDQSFACKVKRWRRSSIGAVPESRKCRLLRILFAHRASRCSCAGCVRHCTLASIRLRRV